MRFVSSGTRSLRPARLRATAACCALVCATLWPALARAQDSTSDTSAINEQYREGLYLRETGRPYSAIETLESLLQANPTLNRARLELAVTYYRTLEFAKARAEAQRVLDDPKTPANVRLAVQSFLTQLELDEKATFGQPNKFEISGLAGLVYDSNVTAGPTSTLLPNGFTLDASGAPKSDWGVDLQAGLTHTWQSSNPVRLGETTSRFLWTTSGSLYHRGYDQEKHYNLGVATLATGPGLISRNGMRANLNLQVDHLTLGGENLANYWSISPAIALPAAQGEFDADLQFMDRDYHRDIDQGRDGHYRSVGLSYGHLSFGNRLAVQGGVRFSVENARDARFSNNSSEPFIGLHWRAWEGGDLYGRLSHRHSLFKAPEPIYDIERHENENRIELGANHRFNSGWLDNWQWANSITYIRNRANIGLYDYRRTLFVTSLGRSY